MEFDLLAGPPPQRDVGCDVCIIGAGAAGLFLATGLAARGLSVVILEAGGKVCGDSASVGIEPLFTAAVYPGATVGRAFGLGGTTSRWGGLLAPHSRHDERDRGAERFDPWRLIVSRVESRANDVLARLGFRDGDDFGRLPSSRIGSAVEALRARGLETLAARFLPLLSRNMTYLLSRSPGRIQVFLNATGNSWKVGSARGGRSHVISVGAASMSGNEVKIRPRQVVLAAGAIESARILLELERSVPAPVLSETAEIGRNLSDHLSCPIADISPSERSRAAGIFGPRFIGGGLRTFRFIESGLPADVPRSFSHFIFEIDNPGFALVKETISALQARRFPAVSPVQAFRGGTGLFALAYSRYVESRLYVPNGSPAHLQLDIEQTPVESNAVSLSDDRDCFGRHVARINWRVNEADLENIRDAAKRLIEKWPGASAGLPDLTPVFDDGRGPKPHDAYHPVGTCRLGTDKGAVVDPDLRANGTDNLWVLSTAVLPTAGTANPTFTMLCLGEELADRLAEESEGHGA